MPPCQSKRLLNSRSSWLSTQGLLRALRDEVVALANNRHRYNVSEGHWHAVVVRNLTPGQSLILTFQLTPTLSQLASSYYRSQTDSDPVHRGICKFNYAKGVRSGAATCA